MSIPQIKSSPQCTVMVVPGLELTEIRTDFSKIYDQATEFQGTNVQPKKVQAENVQAIEDQEQKNLCLVCCFCVVPDKKEEGKLCFSCCCHCWLF